MIDAITRSSSICCLAVTVKVQEAVFPFTVVAVITAVPADFAVTLPFSSTEATAGAELLHATVRLAALTGSTVAVSVVSLPSTSAACVLFSSTEVGCTSDSVPPVSE